MDTMDKYLGARLDDRYEILETIGAGGMAVVYKALDHRLGRKVAVKILRDDLASDEEFLHRFKTEAQAIAMLSHPNIVSVYDVSRWGEAEYIVMELIDGITLMQYMKRKGALGWKEGLHFSVQITKALEHAHEKGIVHRDIKPQNIMILKDGTIKVADFGIAALESAQEGKSELTIGSVHYIAPEQAKGEVADARSDIYSLGVVMYEMLTGVLPYEADSVGEVARLHISGNPTPPTQLNREIPPELERITLRAMCSVIAGRYQSADELLEDLEQFRKLQAAVISQTSRMSAVRAEDFTDDEISRDVTPISSDGEMTKENYTRRRRRSRRVSILTGAFGVLVFIIAVFIFLWNYWLKDIFSVAERVEMPDFKGEYYTAIVNNDSFTKLYNFLVSYKVDPDVKDGVIISQDPEPGRSMMVVPGGIDVSLTVSTGVVMTEIPDVVNWQYQEATIELQNAGFDVEKTVVASDTVTEGYVISTSPSGGAKLSAGNTVFIYVSGGATLKMISVPNTIGLGETEALSRLSSSGFVGSPIYAHSSYDLGVVYKQSVPAYEEAEEHSTIFIWVSKGPEETPTPSPEESAEPSVPQEAATPPAGG